MDNQHRSIKGYRDLTQHEIDLMNKIKAFGPQLESLINEIHDHLNSQVGDMFDSDIDFEPFKWMDMGKRDLQTGLMFLTRAVAQPNSF